MPSSSRTRATGGMRMTDDASYEMQSETAVFLDSPATTSATTYKVQWTQAYSSSGEYAYINRSYDDNDADDRNRCAFQYYSHGNCSINNIIRN